MIVRVLHPGQMGSALGAVLRNQGHDVVWASEGRSEATRARAADAGLRDLGSVTAVADAAELVVSVCPPYLSGGDAPDVALKMTYAAWSKGSAALLLAIRDTARAYRVEDDLRREWGESVPELPGLLESAERSAAAKAWRWAGEMDEIADTFAAAGQPDGFHRAAAVVYRS